MSTENEAADWSVLDLDGVRERCQIAARRVAQASSSQVHLDAADLEQEAYLLCATRADKVRHYLAKGGLALLYIWIRDRLRNKVETELNRAGRSTSYEAALEGWGE